MYILIIAILALAVAGVVLYNRLIRGRNRVDTAWSDIDVQLQRRHDLIPNLVKAVDQYASYERATLEAVTELRAQAKRVTDVEQRGRAEAELGAGERELLDGLFRDGDTVILDVEYHELLGEAKASHRESLKTDYKQRYFRTNGLLNLPAIFIVIGATVVAISMGPSPFVIATIIAMFVTLVFFAIIMKRPTMRGRQLLDQMLGFKDYLEIADKDKMNLRNPPEKTPELFEAYLPYALALGVEQHWGERFASILGSIRNPDGSSYHPVWYAGSWNSFDLRSSTSGLSSGLNTAISSSVTPPGSSSGGGGGGFSGGGGGGGGW